MRGNQCGRGRVLIVDNSPVFRGVARELLEHRGYLVAEEADSAKAAVEAVERRAPDAALIDTNLPHPDGIALACHISVAHPAVAVLLVSDDPAPDIEGLLMRTGARGFVTKSELARVELGDYWPEPDPGG
ncbi:MAG TPA: response regulator [Solirubrobacteraceae bacterium]